MNKNISKIVSLKVGKIEKLSFNEKVVKTAINKKVVKSSYLTKLGFEDDEQFDKRFHGGENKAVLFFSEISYKKIEKILDIDLNYLDSSPLGENILLDKVGEEDICIGDIFKIGEAIVQVTQPREPCNKLNLNTNEKKMLKTVHQNGFTGWYAKVIEEGIVNSDDSIELIKRSYENLNISSLNKAVLNAFENEKIIKEGIDCEVLGKPFKEVLIRLYK